MSEPHPNVLVHLAALDAFDRYDVAGMVAEGQVSLSEPEQVDELRGAAATRKDAA